MPTTTPLPLTPTMPSSPLCNLGGDSIIASPWLEQDDGGRQQHLNVGLHHAAASGNIGMVTFALQHGQPTNSVLNGILPLHAAASGGDTAIVRLLITHGADVNGGRLKTASDSATSSIGTGAEGSTPLHFAAANGHVNTVRVLLENGARPLAQDRDGVTPEALAVSNGHTAVVSLLRNWIDRPGADRSPESFSDNLTTSSMRQQRSFEHLTSAAAGVKASLRSTKRQALSKVSSNPNLRSAVSSGGPKTAGNVPAVPQLPTMVARELRSRAGSVFGSPGTNLLGLKSSTGSNQSAFMPSSSTSSTRTSKRRPSLPTLLDRHIHHASDGEGLMRQASGRANDNASVGVFRQFVSQRSQLLGKNVKSALGMETSSSDQPAHRPSLPGGRVRVSSVSSSSTSTSTDHAQYQARKLSSDRVGLYGSSPTNDELKQRLDLDSSSSSGGRPRSQSTTNVPYRLTRTLQAGVQLSAQNRQEEDRKDPYEDAQEYLAPSSDSQPRRSRLRDVLLSERGSQSSVGHVPLEEADLMPLSSSLPHVGMERAGRNSAPGSPTSTSAGRSQSKAATNNNAVRHLIGPYSRTSNVSSAATSPTTVRSELDNTLVHAGRSNSTASASMVSKASTSSLRSVGPVLTASDHAQAIIRSGEDGSLHLAEDGTPMTLSQMLAAYGEALAQEGKTMSGTPSQSVQRQASYASLSSIRQQLPSVREDAAPLEHQASKHDPLRTGNIRILPSSDLKGIPSPTLHSRVRAESNFGQAHASATSPSVVAKRRKSGSMWMAIDGEQGDLALSAFDGSAKKEGGSIQGEVRPALTTKSPSADTARTTPLGMSRPESLTDGASLPSEKAQAAAVARSVFAIRHSDERSRNVYGGPDLSANPFEGPASATTTPLKRTPMLPDSLSSIDRGLRRIGIESPATPTKCSIIRHRPSFGDALSSEDAANVLPSSERLHRTQSYSDLLNQSFAPSDSLFDGRSTLSSHPFGLQRHQPASLGTSPQSSTDTTKGSMGSPGISRGLSADHLPSSAEGAGGSKPKRRGGVRALLNGIKSSVKPR